MTSATMPTSVVMARIVRMADWPRCRRGCGGATPPASGLPG